MMNLQGVLADRDSWTADSCSIAKALEIIGTRSAMLILREALYGATRFDEFTRRVGITDAVAAARLKELTAAGIFDKVPYREPGRRVRHEYQLTEMGRDLQPVVLSLMQWGNRYLQPNGAPLRLTDSGSGDPIIVDVRTESGAIVEEIDVAVARRRR
ncbi:winged helix-turn-helix transcriptional regulator [Gordonia insulae]|uniref:Putative HTH-type transcriptional regulator n=1 Tax=Gordonia insulae TaxID=2420509 RepID=A0A3G8JPU2_9ACTN|nr:helix-turn-helix domain-containing protein [Gordonia insulae]AZG46976.1 putative HTH-type transcriptional regulator [Gordonia insulae]